MIKNTYKKVLRWVSCLALVGTLLGGAAFADEVASFEFHGYARAGLILNAGLAQPGNGNKNMVGRLGMENDSPYMEAELVKGWNGTNGEWAKYHVAFAQGTGDKNDWVGGVAVRQVYAEMGNLSFAPKATIWAGKRFYGRDDIYITDFYWRDFSGTGIGIDTGKMQLALIGRNPFEETVTVGDVTTTQNVSNDDGVIQPITLDARYKVTDKIQVEAALTFANGYDDVDGQPAVGFQGAAVIELPKFYAAMNGWSKAAIQVGSAVNVGTANISSNEDLLQVRALTFGVMELEGMNIMNQLVINWEDNGNDTKLDISEVARLDKSLSKNMSLLVEMGIASYTGDQYGDAEGIEYKITAGPAFTLDSGNFWAKPQISTYVSFIGQSEDRGTLSANGEDESEVRFGTKMEAWF